MTLKQLEKRLTLLEEQVCALQLEKARHGWRALIGLSTDDPVMKEVCKLALESREAERRKARKKIKSRRRS